MIIIIIKIFYEYFSIVSHQLLCIRHPHRRTVVHSGILHIIAIDDRSEENVIKNLTSAIEIYKQTIYINCEKASFIMNNHYLHYYSMFI